MIRLREVMDRLGYAPHYSEKQWLDKNLKDYAFTSDDIATFSVSDRFICNGLPTNRRIRHHIFISDRFADCILNNIKAPMVTADGEYEGVIIPELNPKPESELKPESEPKPEAVSRNALFDELEKLREYVKSVEKDVIFAKAIRSSEDTICVRDFAKILLQNNIAIGERQLFKFLHDDGWLEPDDPRYNNVPTVKAIESGYFELSEVVITVSSGRSHISISPRLTGKGQGYFVDYFLKKGDS